MRAIAALMDSGVYLIWSGLRCKLWMGVVRWPGNPPANDAKFMKPVFNDGLSAPLIPALKVRATTRVPTSLAPAFSAFSPTHPDCACRHHSSLINQRDAFPNARVQVKPISRPRCLPNFVPQPDLIQSSLGLTVSFSLTGLQGLTDTCHKTIPVLWYANQNQ